ncbi:MAG: hypothetical protein V5A51_09855 [Bacteroidales bacterium]|nr:hypothetical protein [Bacteroidales bacterium]MBS3776840.1 hypothetical protein [Bacteroidales bacterium]
MEFIRIEIINPKAKRLINDLADMGLIKIKKEQAKSEFSELLDRLRNQSESAPSLEEINKEIESVRKARYEK